MSDASVASHARVKVRCLARGAVRQPASLRRVRSRNKSGAKEREMNDGDEVYLEAAS